MKPITSMSIGKPVKDVKDINFVHKSIIHQENIKNERKYEGKNFKFDYTFSPYTCIQIYIIFSLPTCREADINPTNETIYHKGNNFPTR
jgi:hypothetical protein